MSHGHHHANDVVQTDQQALDALAAAGYTVVTNLAHHGRVWRADAVDAATSLPVVVVVHGRDGKVTVETETETDNEPTEAA